MVWQFVELDLGGVRSGWDGLGLWEIAGRRLSECWLDIKSRVAELKSRLKNEDILILGFMYNDHLHFSQQSSHFVKLKRIASLTSYICEQKLHHVKQMYFYEYMNTTYSVRPSVVIVKFMPLPSAKSEKERRVYIQTSRSCLPRVSPSVPSLFQLLGGM